MTISTTKTSGQTIADEQSSSPSASGKLSWLREDEFSLSNAFHESTASIRRVQMRTLQRNNAIATHPIGAVGIIASDEADLANCVREMVTHFDHYRDTAMRFSNRWRALHEPQATLDFLVDAYQQSGSAARAFA
mgnify:CR=1 FL=1